LDDGDEADVTENATKKMTGNEIREKFLQFFREQGALARAVVFAGAAWGSDAAVYERGNEPVQGRVSRPREAGVFTGDDGAEVA